jgi:hypothetical protein
MREYPKINTVYKRDEKTHKVLIGNYSLPEFEYLKDAQWRFQEKVDGCLHYGQYIQTDMGRLPVGKIVENRLPINVLSMNIEKGVTEFKPIVSYHKEKRTCPFVSVSLRSRLKGHKPKFIVCTDNHRFYNGSSWIPATDLKEGMKVAHLGRILSEGTRQVILGGLLGDSSIYSPSKTTRGFIFSHSVPQYDYFQFKANILGPLFREVKGTIGGFEGSKPNRRGNSIITPEISELILKLCEVNGKKKITPQWLRQLLPSGLAIWYMDDGSCDFNDRQRPRARLAMNGFSGDEAYLMRDYLESHYSIISDIFDYEGPTLVMTADGTERFFNLIYAFVPFNMKYKLSQELRDCPCSWLPDNQNKMGIIETEVIGVSNQLPVRATQQHTYQYDLEIANNSNYFTNNILVHNTNVRVGWDGDKATFSGRTDNSQMYVPLITRLNELFGNPDIFRETFTPDNSVDATDVTLYGEGFGSRIQKGGGNYIKDGVDFVLFDIRIGNWWLKQEDVNVIAEKLGIKTVPIIGYGTLQDMLDKVGLGFNSAWGDFPAEGIVARTIVGLKDRGGRRIITKLKTKDF